MNLLILIAACAETTIDEGICDTSLAFGEKIWQIEIDTMELDFITCSEGYEPIEEPDPIRRVNSLERRGFGHASPCDWELGMNSVSLACGDAQRYNRLVEITQ